MRKTFSIILLAIAMLVQAQVERPKLVVGFVVDQMRWDYLYYHYNDYGEGGIKRMLAEGFSCENTMIPYVPTVTAIGHTSIYTGSTPALHGICGNNFYIDGRKVYCTEDSTVMSVGSSTKHGKMSPRNNMASTIGDQLKLATDFQAKVVGVALKDRASILPAGHAADGAYWWDDDAKCFITSTFYMNELPKWVQQFNKRISKEKKKDPKNLPEGVALTVDMALAALENEALGEDDITDMLAVSVSTTDIIGHAVGTRAPETKAAYLQLDHDLARLFNELDSRVGQGKWLFFLSADHGAAHNYNFLAEHRIPGGGWEGWNLVKPLNEYLQGKFSVAENLVIGDADYRFYLNHEAIERLGLKLCDVKHEAMAWLAKDKDRIEFVIDFANAQNATVPDLLRQRLCNGFNPHRSGDITVVTRPQVFLTKDNPEYKGTSHGAWNPYDAHIPCVFMGWNVKHGATNRPTAMTDIAPTICAMLHIQMPNACIGTAVTEVCDR